MQSQEAGQAVNPDLINQGVELMIYGMGTVFVFLAVLVVVTVTMSTVVNRFFPDQAPAIEPKAQPQAVPVHAADDQNLLAVISAAVQQHRAKK